MSSPPRTRTDSFAYDPLGRRIHADFTPLSSSPSTTEKVYVLPNDDEEMDRLTMQHYCIRQLFQSNFSAPVAGVLRSGGKVLDLGCGSGIWGMEVGSDFPKSTITGLDISPVQPSTIKPKNVTFLEGDITSLPLPFGDNTFAFVHMRLLVAGLRKEFYPVLIDEMVRILRPGGYIELMEIGDMVYGGEVRGPHLMRI
ncbi:hypothetical protein HDV00_010105, partial [Rhizophlyctis rosea]